MAQQFALTITHDGVLGVSHLRDGKRLVAAFERDYVTTPQGARELVARLLKKGLALPQTLFCFYFIRDYSAGRRLPRATL